VLGGVGEGEAARSGTQFLLKPLKMPELEAILRTVKPLT
jgi:hypothetical protein